METALAYAASDPDVEPPVLPLVIRPENHPLAGIFEDWAWLAVWTAKWLREQRVRKRREQRKARRARARCQTNDVSEEDRNGQPAWRIRVRREANERRERLREDARLSERWAKEEEDDEEEEEFDDAALLAAGFAGVGAAPVWRSSRTGSPTSSHRGEDSSAAGSRETSLPASLSNSPALEPCLDPLVTWVTWAQLLASRHKSSKALTTTSPFPCLLQSEQPVLPEPPPGAASSQAVPALIMRELSLLHSDELIEQENLRPDTTSTLSGVDSGEEIWEDMAKRWHVSLEGMEVKAHRQITDLLHEFVGPEEFRRLDAAASVQRRLLHELVEVDEEQDNDVDVWNEAQRHAVAQILEGGSQSNELANVPVPAMGRLLASRGYELPLAEKAENLGRGSFGRVLKVRRREDGKLFAVKRQFLGDFADDMVPVLRECSILNLLKGACNVVQIEDAFLMRPAKGAAEVWSVLEHFPHNMYKVRHRFRSEEAARRVVFQVLLGLNALHSADIVHRDIKPDNVLVDLGKSPPYTVRVALCDFNTSRSVHGFPAERPQTMTSSSPELPTLPLMRSVTDRVTTSWWRAPEMWGWADTGQMTKRDLKSLDVFALGLVWAELLAVKSVLEYSEKQDPPKFRLLEILQKVDRPALADLQELGFSDDVSCFILCALKGDLEALRPEMTSPKWPQNQEKREALLQKPYIGIRAWVQQNAWQLPQDSVTPDLIASIARFSYRERPTVESLMEHQYFSDFRAEVPPKVTAQRKASDDVRDAVRCEHERQGLAAKRAKELRELRGDGGVSGADAAQDAFFQRLEANTAADVEESVRSVCARVRKVIKETHRWGPRGNCVRPSGCQGYPGPSIRHSNVPR